MTTVHQIEAQAVCGWMDGACTHVHVAEALALDVAPKFTPNLIIAAQTDKSNWIRLILRRLTK